MSISNARLSDKVRRDLNYIMVTLAQTDRRLEPQDLHRAVDHVLDRMHDVKTKMAMFEVYIQVQKDDNKPLYQWDQYSGYALLTRAISELVEATAKVKPCHLPKEDVKVYLRTATHSSLFVSKVAAFAMSVMGEKVDTCIDEIEESDMSAEGRRMAKTLVLAELKVLIKHSTRATRHIYAALDVLQQSLTTEADRNLAIVSIKEIKSKSDVQRHSTYVNLVWAMVGLVLGVGLTACLCRQAGAKLVLSSREQGNGPCSYLDFVHRTQVVTNLTGEVYSMIRHDIHNRYQEVAAITEANTLRIDNLVDALGPTNEEGVYYSAMPKLDYTVPDSVHQEIRKMSDNAAREMKQMRKNINRMDLRLTKRIDKIDRTG
ncbi:Nn.00g036490.m01.CDS01 [Neocucurbitaria sp. VM-36]